MASLEYGGIVEQLAATATAAGTTTLTNVSKQIQVFTGTAAQTIVLPDATTMSIGQKFEIYNQSTSSLTLQFNGGAAFTDAAGTARGVIATNTSLVAKVQTVGTAAGTWAVTISAAGAAGTVTSASVVTANGFSGTVATPTTTPAITVGTSVTGLLKGNGTSVSAATSGTDYVIPSVTTLPSLALPASQITSGTLPLLRGGTNNSLSLNGNRFMVSDGSSILEAAAVTPSRAMASDANGLPVASSTNSGELGFLSGVTGSVQTQLNNKVNLGILQNPNAETGVTSWATYANTAGVVPITGTGGSPTVTWTQNTTTPLNGTASFLYTKPASNVQGNGVATAAFAVPEVYRGTVLQGQLAYKVTSGTYADGDLQLFFYDITNSVLVYMTEGQSILNAVGAAQQLFRFQMPYNCLSGRFIIHQASTSSSALTLLIDDVQIGPQLVSRGVAVTDWVAFTPSITNGGTTGSNQAWYRRVGDTAELQYYTVFTGTGSSGNMQWSFPTGLVLDTTKTTGGNGRTVAGAGTWNSSASSTNIMANPQPASTTTVSLLQSGINGILQGSSAVSGDVIAFHLVIPVLGWSSNVAVSSDIGSRPIVFSASAQLPTASLTNGYFVTMTFPTATVDTVGGYSGGIYTIKETGWYDLDFDTFITGSFGTYGGAFAGFKINGSGQSYYRYNELSGTAVVLSVGSHPTGLLLTAGTTIQPVVETLGWSSVSVGADTNMHFFGVKKSSSSSKTIAASDPVTAQYFDTSAPSLNNGPNTLLYGTKGFDSHGAYNTSTGIYTFPAPGKYLLSATYVVTGLATTAQFIILTANINSGSLIYTLGQTPGDGATTTFSVNGSTIINAKAGDTLQLQLATSTAGNQTGANGAGKNYFSLARISN
jgi:hypothetical protein